MHLLALTAGAALASIAPATAPPGAPPAGAVPAGTYTLEDSFAGAPFTVTLTVPEGWTYDAQFSAPLGVRRDRVHHPDLDGVEQQRSGRQLRLEGERRDHGRDGRRAGGGDGPAARLVGQRSPTPADRLLHAGSCSPPRRSPGPTATRRAGRERPNGDQMVFMDDNRDGWWYHGDGIHDVKTFLALDFESGLGVIEVGTYAPLLPEDQRELLAIIDSIDVVENP